MQCYVRVFGLLCALLVSACGSTLEFRHESVLGAVPDPRSGSTRVSLSFEVWDGPRQITNLTPANFTVVEDGQAATSESFAAARSSEHRVPVVLLLDTSLSMYQANAVAALKQAATQFGQALSTGGFEVLTYRFASRIEPLTSIDQVPDVFNEAGGERWTSLYAAVARGLADRPDAILVVFSDGADNYSQNHGVNGLAAVERDVLPLQLAGSGARRVIHTIGFGNVQSEHDRQGVAGGAALERLARNGSFHFARDPSAFGVVFQDVANRIRNIYVFDYFSPNLSGAHAISLQARVDSRRAQSAQMSFVAGGAPGASASAQPDLAAAQAQSVAVRALSAEHQAALAVCRREPPGTPACVRFYDLHERVLGVAGVNLAAIREAMRMNTIEVEIVRPGCGPGRPLICSMFEGNPPPPAAQWTGVFWNMRTEPCCGVVRVVAGTSAATVGIQTGDTITSVDGQEPRSALRVLSARPAGSQVTFGVLRAGQPLTIVVPMEPRPPYWDPRLQQPAPP